jgi:hypothetical protein
VRKAQAVMDDPPYERRLLVKRHAQVLQPHENARESEEGAEIQPNDLPPLAPPAQVFVEARRTSRRVGAVQPGQQLFVVGLRLDWEPDVVRNARQFFAPAQDGAAVVLDDLVGPVVLEHLLLKRGKEFLIDRKPVEVEADVQA